MESFVHGLNWAMLGASILGFGKLCYERRWARAFVASILAGISLYMMIFF